MSNTAINIPVTVANAANAATVDLSNYGPKRTFSFVGPANSIVKIFGSGDGTNFPSITSTPLIAIAANSPPVTIDDLCLKYRAVPTAIGTACTVDCPPQDAAGGGGAAFLNTCQVANKLTGGAIGSAADTVDAYEAAQCSQSTAGQDLTLPAPTDTDASRRFYLENIGSTTFTAYGCTVLIGAWIELIWNGSSWTANVGSNDGSTSIVGTSATNVTILAAGLTITSAGNVDINVGAGGTLNVGTNGTAHTTNVGSPTTTSTTNILGGTGGITIGTSAVAQTIAIGNGTGATAVTINSGTGGIAIGTNAVAMAITIGNGTGATSVAISGGTGAMSFGANAIAHAVTIGTTTGAGSLALRAGTGGLTIVNNGVTWTWPTADGANGTKLTTNGAGGLSFT